MMLHGKGWRVAVTVYYNFHTIQIRTQWLAVTNVGMEGKKKVLGGCMNFRSSDCHVLAARN